MKSNKIDVIFEDETLIVVDKPTGLLSIPDRFDADLPNLKQILRESGDIFTVHRLDKDTSGLIVFAKTEAAHKHLSQQFSTHTARKHYLALVEGVPVPAEGEINLPLIEHPRKAGRMMTASKGLNAHTLYRTERNFASVSLLEVEITTGRTHQIRVHLQAIGHSVVADPFYGRRAAFFLSSIKGKKFNIGKHQDEQPLLARTALHAAKLQIVHPQTEALLTFESPLPKDLRAVVSQLEKWDK